MCIILCTKINGKQILAKNRDTIHYPSTEIVHEIVNGIEIAYIKDKTTGWIEGLNENGLGLVNSTFNLNDVFIKHKQIYKNGVYRALTEKSIGDIINYCKNKYTIEGNTILFYNNELIHIENDNQNENYNENDCFVEKIKNNTVYSNLGIHFKKGFIKGIGGMSSFLRYKIAKKELKDNKIHSIEKLSEIMNTNYKNIHPRFHVYRTQPSPVRTTGQLILNMSDLILTYYYDIHNCKGVKYNNKLPKDYPPKIRIVIKATKKNIKNSKTIFTKKYLKHIQHKYNNNLLLPDHVDDMGHRHTNTLCGSVNNCKTKKNIHKNLHNKTKKNK